MASEAVNPVIFAGTFRYGIDSKKRITIPVSWRTGGDSEAFFVRMDSMGTCIQVIPPATFRAMKEQIDSNPNTSPRERQQQVRQFASEALACTTDKQGRMVLPPEFCAQACLTGQIALVGVFDRFEIWDAARWKATEAAQKSAYINSASQLGL